MAEFKVNYLSKTDSSITCNPNTTKYDVEWCSGKITNKTPTTESWLKVLRLIKLHTSDYDKSRVILGELEKYGHIVIKIGDTEDIYNEYQYSKLLYNTKGFVKYICYFTCNDDFRTIPSANRDSLCKGEGSSMKVILMPYFPLGSVAMFKWDNKTLHIFKTCLKHATVSIIIAFHSVKVIHGDFHPGNVLLKETKQASIEYSILEIGFNVSIPTNGIRTWIMDFENTSIVLDNSIYNRMMELNNFYFDLNKFFTLLYNTIKVIDTKTTAPISTYINKLNMKGNTMTKDDITYMLSLIDNIQFISTPTNR
jgi:serine/threonine protein kinase